MDALAVLVAVGVSGGPVSGPHSRTPWSSLFSSSSSSLGSSLPPLSSSFLSSSLEARSVDEGPSRFPLESASFGYASAILSDSIAFVPAATSARWPSSVPFGSSKALDTLAALVDLGGLSIPPLVVLPEVCGLPTAVGCWDGTRISLVEGLSDEAAFYTTLHELLHWGGFGDVNTERAAQAVWRLDHSASTVPTFFRAGSPFVGHWNTDGLPRSTRHVRSGMKTEAELMDPHLRFSVGQQHVSAYLSAASLAACSHFDGRGTWCHTSSDCGGSACSSIGLLLPQTCAPVTGVATDTDQRGLDRFTIIGFTVLGVAVASILLIGLGSLGGSE